MNLTPSENINTVGVPYPVRTRYGQFDSTASFRVENNERKQGMILRYGAIYLSPPAGSRSLRDLVSLDLQ